MTSSILQSRPDGLRIDRRDAQEAVEVSVRFTLREGERLHQGVRLSRRHLVVTDDGQGEAIPASEPRDVVLQVELSGFNLVLPLRVVAGPAAPVGFVRLDIVEMTKRAEATLVQLVRTALTGWLPQAEDLARGWDEETPVQAAPAPPSNGKPVHWLPITASILLLLLGLGVAGYQSYLALTTIPTAAAAVTSARYDVISSEYGLVAEGALPAGTEVVDGQVLLRVESAELDSDLALIAAELEPETPPPASAVQLRGVSTDPSDTAAAAVAARRDRELGRLRALERRSAALSFSAHCTCTVLWTAPPGTAVAPGALLMSLVVSDPDQIRVEALINPRDALAVRPGQAALVRFANDETRHRAIVQQVRYDTSPVPMVGLGTDRDDRATVILKLDDPENAAIPGSPANVTIIK